MAVLFHYTDVDGFHSILNDKLIKKSSSRAAHGPGVYLTTLRPRTDPKILVVNNWDGRTKEDIESFYGQVSYFFRFEEAKLPGVTKSSSVRDEWVYHHDIDLKVVKFDCGATSSLQELKDFNPSYVPPPSTKRPHVC